MSPAVPILIVVGAIILWWGSRASDLFCLSVRDAKVIIVRGRIPPELFSSIRDVVAMLKTKRATIRAVKDNGGARIDVMGTPNDELGQRVRNMFSLYPVARLRHAKMIDRPTMGQLLGIAWLAWLFDRTRG
jgi:hypothetical protein